MRFRVEQSEREILVEARQGILSPLRAASVEELFSRAAVNNGNINIELPDGTKIAVSLDEARQYRLAQQYLNTNEGIALQLLHEFSQPPTASLGGTTVELSSLNGGAVASLQDRGLPLEAIETLMDEGKPIFWQQEQTPFGIHTNWQAIDPEEAPKDS